MDDEVFEQLLRMAGYTVLERERIVTHLWSLLLLAARGAAPESFALLVVRMR